MRANHRHDANADWRHWTEVTLPDLLLAPGEEQITVWGVWQYQSLRPPSEIDWRSEICFPGKSRLVIGSFT